jgi:excisionase family DNA binding protein
MSASNESKFLTVKDVARQLECSNSFVYSLYKTGKLDGIRLSKRFIRFKQENVDKLLKKNLEGI